MITAKDYQDAINVQNACNASGVAQSLASVIKEIEAESTDERNTHPIVKLYVYKLFLLAFPEVEHPNCFERPYLQACDAAEGKIVVA